ncbi:MAG: mannose-1-phosphate guanylyltransferase/mannose-6-phosphate isomerase, partial [Proteobacteria bacterium]|nr:mannose-1-phosphate guanylyltransferase/mannose-6-phosphate isomerase [Pseudomonadota bacterium]
ERTGRDTRNMSKAEHNVYPVLLAGGTGTRLWPVSRELYPKQLVKFIGDYSLVQSTMKRLEPVLDVNRVRIVCAKEHFHETARHMNGIGIQPDGKIICEPCGRNTAPAILLAMLDVLKKEKDAVLCIFPADHVIRNIPLFHDKLKSAIKLAEENYIVTFGIKPNYPETGYGYIEGGRAVSSGACIIKRFVEKPDKKTAERYLEAGNFYWNSGMFAFRAGVMLEEFKKFQPVLLDMMMEINAKRSLLTKKRYEKLDNISIDVAIMENTKKGVVLPSDFGWSDIGSWKSLYDFLPKDEKNNVIDGDVVAENTTNCFIMGRQRLIAVNRLDNMVVVDTPDSVFVSDIENSRDVKNIVATLKQNKRKEYQQHRTIHYPWGSITLLEQKDDFKVTSLVIYPGSMYRMKNSAAFIKQLVVVNGTVKADTGRRLRSLGRGKAVLISSKGFTAILNSGDNPAEVICVETGK